MLKQLFTLHGWWQLKFRYCLEMLAYDFRYLELLEPERLVDLHPFLLWTVWKDSFSFHDPAAFAQLTVEARIWRYHLGILVTVFVMRFPQKCLKSNLYMFANSGDNGDPIAIIILHAGTKLEYVVCTQNVNLFIRVSTKFLIWSQRKDPILSCIYLLTEPHHWYLGE